MVTFFARTGKKKRGRTNVLKKSANESERGAVRTDMVGVRKGWQGKTFRVVQKEKNLRGTPVFIKDDETAGSPSKSKCISVVHHGKPCLQEGKWNDEGSRKKVAEKTRALAWMLTALRLAQKTVQKTLIYSLRVVAGGELRS